MSVIKSVKRFALRPFQLCRTGLQWRHRERLFRRFLKTANLSVATATAADAALIVVQPWLGTALPWFMFTLGAGFRARGRAVVFVIDDLPFGPDDLAQRVQRQSICRIARQIAATFPCIRLSALTATSTSSLTAAELERQVAMNLVIRYRGETLPVGSEPAAESIRATLLKTVGYVRALLEKQRPAYVLFGGGVFSSSGVWFQVGRQLGLRMATVDCGAGITVVCGDGIAANLDDIPQAFARLPEDDEKSVLAAAQAEMSRRIKGKDVLSSQSIPACGQGERFGILLPLNQSFDTSALGRHRFFHNQMDWMLKTAAWVLNSTDETIVIRQHPCERVPVCASTDRFADVLRQNFGSHPRLRFISAFEPINTYDLLERCSVVVPYVSTVGIEAACLGKPVVTEGDNCYANLGFVWSAANREEYFKLIAEGLAGRLKVSAEQRQAAWRCYYLTQCMNYYYTTFTPTATDFDRWVLQSPETIFQCQDMQILFEALDGNVPLALIQHEMTRHKSVLATTD
ncbi:MAG: hypothetical protein V1899_10785 [Planctomycetota bacterium]